MSPADEPRPAGPRPTPFPLRARLRAETGDAHERLDAALASYDLADPADYARFLAVHARALPALEGALAGRAPWPGWVPRWPALAADLAALGHAPPPPLPFDAPASDAEAWGMLYVIEGSKLGGAMLARRVGPNLPAAYLGKGHGPGEWRDFLAAMETGVRSGRYASLAVAGANRAFTLFATAASLECPVA